MNAEEEIKIARALLVLDHCFWGMLAMRLKLVIGGIPPWLPQTMATDGEVLNLTPEFVAELSNDERIGVLAHEVMHCCMGDVWRLDGRDQLIWNSACDYVNNLILVDAGFTLPKGGLIDNTYRNKSKEEVYKILMKLAKGKGKDGIGVPGQGKGQGNGCGSFYKPPHDPANPGKTKEAEVEWKAATAQAVQMSQGTLPGNMKKLIKDDVLDPPLPWHVIFRDFLVRTARNDYNWTRPNRRYLPQGIILPGLLSDELPMVAVIADTSGSTADFQPVFAKETSAILSAFQTTITFLQVDAAVQEAKEYRTEDLPLEFTVKGYGGTDFRPAFDYIKEQGIMPACMVYLTDLYGTFPKKEPDYPVLWVSVTPDKKAPWGETVEMRLPN